MGLLAKTIQIMNTQERYSQEPQQKPKRVTWDKQLTTVLTAPSAKLAELKLPLSIPTPPLIQEPLTGPHQTEGGKAGMDEVIAELKQKHAQMNIEKMSNYEDISESTKL